MLEPNLQLENITVTDSENKSGLFDLLIFTFLYKLKQNNNN